jgi:hypothetical protein
MSQKKNYQHQAGGVEIVKGLDGRFYVRFIFNTEEGQVLFMNGQWLWVRGGPEAVKAKAIDFAKRLLSHMGCTDCILQEESPWNGRN